MSYFRNFLCCSRQLNVEGFVRIILPLLSQAKYIRLDVIMGNTFIEAFLGGDIGGTGNIADFPVVDHYNPCDGGSGATQCLPDTFFEYTKLHRLWGDDGLGP